MSAEIINQLYQMALERKQANPDTSYVASLYHKGTSHIAQKVGEEALETVIEAMRGDSEKLRAESADLIFHLMVLWADQGVCPEDVWEELKRRQGTGGLEEKASRPK